MSPSMCQFPYKDKEVEKSLFHGLKTNVAAKCTYKPQKLSSHILVYDDIAPNLHQQLLTFERKNKLFGREEESFKVRCRLYEMIKFNTLTYHPHEEVYHLYLMLVATPPFHASFFLFFLFLREFVWNSELLPLFLVFQGHYSAPSKNKWVENNFHYFYSNEKLILVLIFQINLIRHRITNTRTTLQTTILHYRGMGLILSGIR